MRDYLHIFAQMYLHRFWLRHTVRLVDYIIEQGKGRTQYTNLCHHIIKYKGEAVLMYEVDKAYLAGFVEYLKTASPEYVKYKCRKREKHLSKGTQLTYYNLFRSILNAAVKDSILESNPASKLTSSQKPHHYEASRTFLTVEEVKMLSGTEVSNQDKPICDAFLFCCFCGLRYSDVSSLKWNQLQYLSDGRCQLALIQKKTARTLYLPLSKNAVKCMPERGSDKDDDLIFKLPPYWDINKALDRWAKEAGIRKHITFHISRHTFATMALNYGADIYTVSKLLGHSSVTTTQIYAKIVDKTKREAVEMIPDIIDHRE